MVEQKPQGRMTNLELLRCIAMLMIVTLHFLDKGGILAPLTQREMRPYEYLAWILEAFSIVAVNVYMLISGFFLVESSFKLSRLTKLYFQVWIYSALVGGIGMAAGYAPAEGVTTHTFLTLLFPISMNHYWFLTAYLLLYLFLPILSAGAKKLTKKEFQLLLLCLFVVFSAIKSVLPVRLETDASGYDCIWYMCMFLLGAYIRLHGIPFMKNKKRGLLLYLAGVCFILLEAFGLRAVYMRTGRLETLLSVSFSYNHIFVLLSALGLFFVFYGLQIREGAFSRFCTRLAPYVLGVYLLHENIVIRYAWPRWIMRFTGEVNSIFSLLIGWAAALLLVFGIGVLADFIRAKCLSGIKLLWKTFHYRVFHVIFLMILALYPLRHIWQGLDLRDTGYSCANYVYMGLEHMDDMWLFSTYLSNAVGHFFSLLPGGKTLLGMNLYTSLILSLTAVLSYLFFAKKIGTPSFLTFLAEGIAVSMCWCPSTILYNNLTYLLFFGGAALLYLGLTKNKNALLFLAGVCLGLNVFVRFPNIAEAALILALWYYGAAAHQGFLKTARQTGYCVLGFLLTVLLFWSYLALRYGAGAYLNGVLRLFDMTEAAPDYRADSMILGIVREFLDMRYWVLRILFFVIIGTLPWLILRGKWQRAKKIFSIGMGAAALCFVLSRGFCSADYTEYESMLRPGLLFLWITVICCLVQMCRKQCKTEEKLLACIVLLQVFLTSIGSNNHLYPSLNNLFLAAPYVFYCLWRFCAPGKPTAGVFYSLKAAAMLFTLLFAVQGIFFGAKFVFVESRGAKKTDTKIENNAILNGIYMEAERAAQIQGISDYVAEAGLGGREVILYGDIPAMSFYLGMPSAFNPWSDLASYGYAVMEKNLEETFAAVEAGEEAPVIILNSPVLEKRQTQGDKKWELLQSYMEQFDYSQTYANDIFALYEAEKRSND